MDNKKNSLYRGEYGGRVGKRNGVGQDVDVANYLNNYGFFYYRKEMLCDRVRMDAYYNAIFKNKEHFHGKTVLDIGTRSGILAIWCAQAGAKKVYAVEATKMYVHARELVKANNLQDVVEVFEGSMVDINLPGKVDVIISEWMGNFLLCESMIDSVIHARERWLKPTGVMYPSHACMMMAPIRTGLGAHKLVDFEYCMDNWNRLVRESKVYYQLDLDVLTDPFSEGQKKYFMQTSILDNLHPKQVIGTPAVIKEINCLTATLTEIFEFREIRLSSTITEKTSLCGFAGWFDVCFRGGTAEVKLTTAPSIDKGTHWGQQVFLLHRSQFFSNNPCVARVLVEKDDALNISFSMTQSKEKHLEVELGYQMIVASDNLSRTDSSNTMLNPKSTGWDSNSESDTWRSSKFLVYPYNLE